MKVISTLRQQIIEPCTLEELEGVGNQIDPYVGCAHRCYYCYAQNRSELDWENEIGIYPDLEERLSRELTMLSPQTVYLGMNTDPYQPIEGEYRQTRKILELLKERSFSVCMLTKSNLVLRDIELLMEMPGTSIGVSIAFIDDETRLLFEGNTMPKKDRIEALAGLKDSGIENYAMICPIMPYITKIEELLYEVRPYANTIWLYKLEMKSKEDRNWKIIEPLIQQHFPEIFKDFSEIVFSTNHPYWNELHRKLEDFKNKENINLKICF